MMSRRWVLGVFVFLIACPAPSASSISLEDFAAEAARADCQLLFDCCTAEEVSGIFTPGMAVASEEECRAYFEMYFTSEATTAQPRIDAGTLTWNADVAGECIAAIDGASCPDIFLGVLAQPISRGPGSLCGTRFGGTLADGAACGTDLDCASGYCSEVDSMRACAQLPALGEPCSTLCAEGLGCDVRATEPTCVVRRADGEACTPGFGDVCESRNCDTLGVCGPAAPIPRCMGTR